MLEFLYRIFIGHNHKWKIVEERVRASHYPGRIQGLVYVLQCEVCGNVKQKDIG